MVSPMTGPLVDSAVIKDMDSGHDGMDQVRARDLRIETNMLVAGPAIVGKYVKAR